MLTSDETRVIKNRNIILWSLTLCVVGYLVLSFGILLGFIESPFLKDKAITLLAICGLAVFYGMIETIGTLYKIIDKMKS
jgi:hypothetical protein